MNEQKQYAKRNSRKLEPYFSKHMLAMTAEDLRGKAEIADELAFRDARIAELEAKVNELTLLSTWIIGDKITGQSIVITPKYIEKLRDKNDELNAENERLKAAQELRTVKLESLDEYEGCITFDAADLFAAFSDAGIKVEVS